MCILRLLRQPLRSEAFPKRETQAVVVILEKSFTKGVAPRGPQDGFTTREEKERLRTFQDQLALENDTTDLQALDNLKRASTDRLTIGSRMPVGDSQYTWRYSLTG